MGGKLAFRGVGRGNVFIYVILILERVSLGLALCVGGYIVLAVAFLSPGPLMSSLVGNCFPPWILS